MACFSRKHLLTVQYTDVDTCCSLSLEVIRGFVWARGASTEWAKLNSHAHPTRVEDG